MNVISLPASLPGLLDLKAVNLALHGGGVTLDWSHVLEASHDSLTLLLAGLDLVEHNDVLGLDTLPSILMNQVQQVLLAGNTHSQHPRSHQKPSKIAPQVWQPEADKQEKQTTPSAEVQVSISAKKVTFLQAPSEAVLRDKLEEMVLLDLLGPAGGPDEEIENGNVRDRYLVGMLSPCDKQITPEEQDELAVAESGGVEDGPLDEGAIQMTSLCPSSMGMSFSVDGAATHLLIIASWGRYVRVTSETIKTSKGNAKLVWKRQQMGGKPKRLSLKEGPVSMWRPEPEEQPEVIVRGQVRRSEGSWTVTLFLVNGQREPEKNRDQAWIFQPELSVMAPDEAPIFQRRPTVRRMNQTDEEQTMAMLYRHKVGFAIGHGVSVHAECVADDSTRAYRLSTSAVPRYDVPRTDAPTSTEIPGLGALVLDMKILAESPMTALPENLSPLATAYAEWIAEQRQRLTNPTDGLVEYRHVAQQAMEECQRTLVRVQEGIALLKNDKQAANAFAFMNRAMWQQRIHTLHAEEVRRGQGMAATSLEEKDIPTNRSWRPFQLAFILLNLPALTNLHHRDRSADASAVADLLWFPTGGGKTEAYLGLTAYTLAIRRLQGTIEGRSAEDGVAVIMRYTLRLLTLQQFQRATALICACEMIRREDTKGTWGQTPFRLGLWVGQRTTPNTTEQSEESNKQERGHYFRGSSIGGVGSPHQLTNCPWCGSSIEQGRDIKVESFARGRGRTFIYCGDRVGRCAFSPRNSAEGLPVVVVDEEIYRLLPSLLIATVDKFAQMPWNGATQMLFGQVDKQCSRHGFHSPDLEDRERHPAILNLPAAKMMPHAPLRPPDLIIQDELHLISGPLGTLVGLYETVVDQLSTWHVAGKKVRPKVIAATATIRRAGQQVQALFMRQVNVFPPQGVGITDTFFARQRKPSAETPGRRYLGICASGRRVKSALVRVYVAYLSAAQKLYLDYGLAADPWMTLVGYFNSINELGGMRRLVEDDIRSRLWNMEKRGLAQRKSPRLEELTSRKSSTDIPQILDQLERVFDPAYQGQPNVPKPLDVLLATNMISVGVDVKRLGLMVVAGQPKTTAEYIQATSRVGRNHPGLVCVVFNWSRPRDLSHYEQFEQYHATFYQQVEALSVTPFAPRAIDRGLAALLVSYVRLLGFEFNENSKAGEVDGAHAYFVRAIEELSQRAVAVTGNHSVGDEVRKELERLRAYWLDKAAKSKGTTLGYKMRKDGKTVPLLRQPGHGNWAAFTCLNSLRDVEPSVNLILDERSLGEPLENDEPFEGMQPSRDGGG